VLIILVIDTGVGALINFAIEGDAGGEDPQVQGLSVYQAGGGLPSKVNLVPGTLIAFPDTNTWFVGLL
jgi:hypothetical protein